MKFKMINKENAYLHAANMAKTSQARKQARENKNHIRRYLLDDSPNKHVDVNEHNQKSLLVRATALESKIKYKLQRDGDCEESIKNSMTSIKQNKDLINKKKQAPPIPVPEKMNVASKEKIVKFATDNSSAIISSLSEAADLTNRNQTIV